MLSICWAGLNPHLRVIARILLDSTRGTAGKCAIVREASGILRDWDWVLDGVGEIEKFIFLFVTIQSYERIMFCDEELSGSFG
jgi:hypothetical protein